MLAELICRRYMSPFGPYSVQFLQVGPFYRAVCAACRDQGGEASEFDAEQLWQELPSPCWMAWFLAGDMLDDKALLDEVRRLARRLDVDSAGDTLDTEKCRLVREALPWERVRQLLAPEVAAR